MGAEGAGVQPCASSMTTPSAARPAAHPAASSERDVATGGFFQTAHEERCYSSQTRGLKKQVCVHRALPARRPDADKS